MSKLPIKKNELFILVGSLLAVMILIGITVLFSSSKNNSDRNSKKESDRILVEGVIAKEGSTGKNQDDEQPGTGSHAFFLKPSAQDVISALRESDDKLEQPPEDSPVLKVMWPGHFLSLTKEESGKALLQLDVDESGFGAILVCRVSLGDYPQLEQLEQGRKIWVAGEVTAIDPEGTGSVYIDVEYVRFDEGPPQAVN
jgi:hypothetical protein